MRIMNTEYDYYEADAAVPGTLNKAMVIWIIYFGSLVCCIMYVDDGSNKVCLRSAVTGENWSSRKAFGLFRKIR
jgi:hypothetical protein